MTQTRDLIKKMAEFFKSEEYFEKGEDVRLELSPDDVRCMYCLSCALCKIKAEIKDQADRLKDSLYGDGMRHCIDIINKYMAEGSETYERN